MRRRDSILLIISAIVPSGPAWAAETADAFVRRFSTEAVQVLKETTGDPAKRRQEFGRFLGSGFDLPTIGRLVLGRYWRSATPEQQAEYQKLFQAFVVDAYGRRLDQYSGQTVRVGATTPAGDDTMVESYVDGGRSGPARLDWRVRPEGDSWRVVDLVVEGVSMAVTQRNEFSAVIDRGGGKIDALLADLRKRTNPTG
jgi:phospholipid transport system substrate-binding protein